MEINGKMYNQMPTINILSRLISEPITYIWICYDGKIKHSFVNIKVLTQKAKTEIEASLVHRGSSWTAKATQRKPVSNDKQGC